MGRLVLYEGWPTPDPDLIAAPPAVMDGVADLIAAGHHEAALETYFRDVGHISGEQLDTFRANDAFWQPRVEAAHAIAREEGAVRQSVLGPEQAREVTVPVLIIVGADSPESLEGDPEALAAALPEATIEELEGQQHLAFALDPGTFADHLLRFLRR